jgi:hypothetical protein
MGGHLERPAAVPTQNIEVRWGLREDEPRIAELMELNGISRALAFEERLIVAEKNGEVLAASRYRMESKRLLLGLLISDPWTEERPLALALYAGAGELARGIGVGEVRVRSIPHADDRLQEAGYRRRYPGGWYLDATRPLRHPKELPGSGCRRMVALQGCLPSRSFGPSADPRAGWTGGTDRGRDDETPPLVAERPEEHRLSKEGRDDGLRDLEAAPRADDARCTARASGEGAACVSQETRVGRRIVCVVGGKEDRRPSAQTV